MNFLPLCLSLDRLLFTLGGPGLLGFGIIDSSLLPTFGALDFVTALLAAGNPGWWLYYALMSTTGAIIGGYMTFTLGRKGGEKALEGRFSKNKVEMVTRRFREWGWGALFLPPLLPPPFPAAPFLFAAGVMGFPTRRFMLVMGIARFIRYMTLAFLASIFGGRVLQALRDRETLLWIGGVILVVGISAAVIWSLVGQRAKKA